MIWAVVGVGDLSFLLRPEEGGPSTTSPRVSELLVVFRIERWDHTPNTGLPGNSGFSTSMHLHAQCSQESQKELCNNFDCKVTKPDLRLPCLQDKERAHFPSQFGVWSPQMLTQSWSHVIGILLLQ